MKLSIIVPGHRPNLWTRLVQSINLSYISHDKEIIFVGPNPLPDELRNTGYIKYVQDFGCPSRCLQIGCLLAEGEYLTYTSDDCIGRIKALQNVVDQAGEYVVSMKYSESPGFSGAPHADNYYLSGTHDDLRKKHVDPNWLTATIFLMKTAKFYQYGGLDCRFEHINMNIHDMCYRMIRNGEQLKLSEEVVWDADYVHRNNSDPVLAAFFENDRPLFNSIYNQDTFNRETYIDINNWKQSPRVWSRRFNNV